MVTRKKQSVEKAKWTYNGKEEFEIPSTAVGFVYRIDVIGTNLYYFGKKNLTSSRGKGKNKKTTESAWRNYESSSKELKELIKNGAKIKKQILEFCFSKSDLSLSETKYIICNGGLEDENSLNKWVVCKIFSRYLNK